MNEPMDPEERESILEELEDLAALRATFEERGFKGVMITCAECGEDHFYGWEMLKESLEWMLQTGEPRMHEPAFEPHPDEYVSWDYGRGYLDALSEVEAVDIEVIERHDQPRSSWLGDRGRCAFCRSKLPQRGASEWAFCPQCGASLAPLRLSDALAARGWSEEDITALMQRSGFEPPLALGEDPAGA